MAVSLAHPEFGPKRVVGGVEAGEVGRLRDLAERGVPGARRHGLNTRAKRRSLVAGYAALGELEQRPAPRAGGLAVDGAGELVQMDRFRVGKLRGTQGVVWQCTAIHVGSAFTWAELHVTPHNASSCHASRLAQRVARELRRFGWELGAVMPDNGSEFRPRAFRETVERLGAEHRFIRSGRPQTNGCVERVHGTILEECWKPVFAQYLVPGLQGLRRDLGGVSSLLQRGPRPHRALDSRADADGGYRCQQDVVRTVNLSHRLRIRTR